MVFTPPGLSLKHSLCDKVKCLFDAGIIVAFLLLLTET